MNEEAAPTLPITSKSARKRAATSLQELGVQLAELGERDLQELDLPENLQAAILHLKNISSRAAQLRQRQYIGKVMRHVDPEPILAKLDERKRRHDLEVRRFQRLERWRDRLIEEPDGALDEFVAQHPTADRPTLARLISAARHQRSTQGPPASARELFVYIRSLQSL